MACTYTFKGKIYSETEFNQFLSDNPTLRNDYLGGNIDVQINNEESDRLIKTAPLNPVIENQIQYTLKSINLLQSNNAIKIFDKGKKNNWSLDKILTELAIPKDQKEIILNKGITNREEIITSLLADNSFVVEINTATETDLSIKGGNYADMFTDEELKNDESETRPTKHYSNLTVPGGTNYTENEIATPTITPSIKGHARFSTDKGIGWGRLDEKVIYSMEYIDFVMNELENSGQLKIKCD